MSMIERMEEELRQARLARDDARRDALALLLSELRKSEKELQRELTRAADIDQHVEPRQRGRRNIAGHRQAHSDAIARFSPTESPCPRRCA